MRNIILVADQDGRITKYMPQPTPEIAQQVQVIHPKNKKGTQNKPKISRTPKCDELVAKMQQYKVTVENLSVSDIDVINTQLKRDGKIRAIQGKINLLCHVRLFFS